MAAHTLTAQLPVSVFTDRVFGHLPRTDQRYWAHAYLVSLLTTEGKKSIRRLAATVSDAPTTSQSMHQFINASPWDWTPARAELTRWAEQRLGPRAWVVDVAVMRKRGEHSCGVHRRFVPSTGRSVNCQVGVGAFLATESAAIPVDWRLLLPGTWVKDPQRRSRARIPDDVVPRSIEQHALDLVDCLADNTNLGTLPVVADLSAYAGASTLVRGLALRGRDFLVAVPGRMPVVPVGRPDPGRCQHSVELPAAVEARRFLDFKYGTHLRVDPPSAQGGRSGSTSVMTALVRLPEVRLSAATPHRTYRLLALQHAAGRGSTRLWLTNMVHRRTEQLIATAQLQRRAGAAVQGLEDEFGLLDFEGRSYPGWHHHMTLVSAAHAYRRLGQPGAQPAAVPQTL